MADLRVVTAGATVVLSVLVGLYALLLTCRNPGWPLRIRWSPCQERRFVPVFFVYLLAIGILVIPGIAELLTD